MGKRQDSLSDVVLNEEKVMISNEGNGAESSMSNTLDELPSEEGNNQLYPASLGLNKSTLPPWLASVPNAVPTPGIELPPGFDPEASLRTVDFGASSETANSDSRRESRSLDDETVSADLDSISDYELSESAQQKLLSELKELGIEPYFSVDEDEKSAYSELSMGNESYILDLAMQKETRENLLKEEALEEAAVLYQQAKQEGHRGQNFFLIIFQQIQKQKTAAKKGFFKLQDERLDQVLESELLNRQKSIRLSNSSHHSQGRKSERVDEFVEREKIRKSGVGMRENMIHAMSELTIQMSDDGDYEWGGDDDDDSDVTVDLAETKEEKIKKKKKRKGKSKPKKKKSKSSKDSGIDEDTKLISPGGKRSKGKKTKKSKSSNDDTENSGSGEMDLEEPQTPKTPKSLKSPSKKKKLKVPKSGSSAKREKVKKLKVPINETDSSDEKKEKKDDSEKGAKKKEKNVRSPTKKPTKKKSKTKKKKTSDTFHSPSVTESENDFQSPDLTSPILPQSAQTKKKLPVAPFVEASEELNSPVQEATKMEPRFGSLDNAQETKRLSPRKRVAKTLAARTSPRKSNSKMGQFVNSIKRASFFRKKKSEDLDDDPGNRLLPIPGSQLRAVN